MPSTMNTDSTGQSEGGAVSAGARGPGAAELGELIDTVNAADRLMARAVTLAGQLAGSGACERLEGLPLELFVGLVGRLTGGDRRMLVTAGETLRDLPTVAQLFAAGRVSWGQVRAIVDAVKGLPTPDRGVIDARVAATVASYTDISAFEPDELTWAVGAAAEECRSARAEQRSETRRAQRDFLSVQPDFEGGVRLYGEFSPVTGAGVLNALDAAAGPPKRPDHDGDNPDAADPADTAGPESDAEPTGAADLIPGVWAPSGRAKHYAAALDRICGDWLGEGTRAVPRRARPLMVAHVDLSTLTPGHTGGTIELGVRGGLPRITAAAAEALAASGDIQAVLFDGARPLAVTDKVNAAAIPTATQVATRARDQGCRFPGSQDPLAHTDTHLWCPARKVGTTTRTISLRSRGATTPWSTTITGR